MPKNSSAFGNIQITPLSGQFDLRSPSGTLPITDFRIVLNSSMNEQGKRCRRGGWRKFGVGSPYGFNNQDLHDIISGTQYYCEPETYTECICPSVPECVAIVDYEYGVVLNNCVEFGADSYAPEWDGTLRRIDSTCSWGFTYGQYSFGGKDVACILSLAGCSNGINTYRFEVVVRLEDGTGIIVWAGDSVATPVGTYVKTDGCDDATSITVIENCGTCVKPVVSFSPPDGSSITTGSFVSLSSTEGGIIFFTTDGSTPDNTDEMYTGPFEVNDSMTIKAIAYTGSCVGDVSSSTYTIESQPLVFQLTCNDEDQVGDFDDFYPNGDEDLNFELTFDLPEVDIVSLEIYQTDSSGNWISGQAWSTKRTIYPVELGGAGYNVYPLVIYDGGNRIASDYTPSVGNFIDSNPAGAYTWLIFAQPFLPVSGYFKLIFTYNDGTEKKIYSLISSECTYYY